MEALPRTIQWTGLPATLVLASLLEAAAPAGAVALQTRTDDPLGFPTEVERELYGGEVLSLELELGASECARLLAETWGLRFRIRVLAPDGEPDRDVPLRTDGPTPLFFVAATPGVHRVEARALGEAAEVGRLRLRVTDRRSCTVRERRRVDAEKRFAEADDLRREYQEAQSRRAIEKYDLAARDLLEIGDTEEAVKAFQRKGDVYFELGAFEKALAAYEGALAIAQPAGAVLAEIELLSDIGIVRAVVGEPEDALGRCRTALGLAEARQYPRGKAEAFICLGEAYYHFGNLGSAIDSYQQAEPLFRALSDRRGQAETHLYIGYARSDSRDFDEALERYREALLHWESLDDDRGRALTHVALGRLYSRVGENQRALNYFNDGMKLVSRMGDRVWEASVSAGIGWVYSQMTDYAEALRYQRRSLQLFRESDYRVAEVDTLLDLGEMLLASGDPGEAQGHFEEALALCRALANARCQAQSLGLIGTIHRSRGDLETALDYYERALTTARADRDLRREALALGDIGEIHVRRGDFAKAEDYFTRALAVSRRATDHFGEAHWLYRLALVEHHRENFGVARRYLAEALGRVESLRRGVESQDLRSAYFASVHPYYELYIDVLMTLHRENPGKGLAAAAFQVSEQARARSFLEMLAAARIDIRHGIDADLLERDRDLARRLDERAEFEVQLMSRGASEEELREVAEEIRRLTADYELLQAMIRSKSPRYAALTQPEPLSLEAIQREVVDEDTVLLEYSLGRKRSYLWAVSSRGWTSYALPSAAEIENRAREVYDLLRARLPAQGESLREYRRRVRDADERYWERARLLSEMLLGPVAGEIGGKRLAIVSDGALLYLPFAALPAPGIEADGGAPVPLVVEHEIAQLPSASLLALSRRERDGRPLPSKMVALFADPVFENDDPRLVGAEAEAARLERPSDLTRALRDFGFPEEAGVRVPRLPATFREAQAIFGLAPEGSSLKATGFEASRSLAMSPELRQYRIVHFATHGLVNSDHAELSGILLSMLDEAGRPQNGFLRLRDIYGLDLEADLVVLSACSTALGEEVRGEGLVGLTRGFMYSGARRVLASLWKVDDEATGELMVRVYQRMLAGNLPPAAALRDAQVSMWREKQWSAPFFWSAFSLQGDWR